MKSESGFSFTIASQPFETNFYRWQLFEFLLGKCSAQYVFCKVYFSAQPNKLRPILKGLASYCKAETTFTFHFSILTLSNAFLGIDNRETKSESGFSFAIASQPLKYF